MLIEMGYAKAFALQGGWNEWVQKGYPLEAK